jgi:glycosyltransferase involved in cell wall biosynthesis
VLNAPSYTAHEFHTVDPARIKVVNHGSAIPGRRIEDLIRMMRLADPRYHLYFLLKPSQMDYYKKLKKKADQIAAGRITFLDIVSPQKITHAVNAFDVGIHTLDANNLNHYNALPKKIFEYIMAGLGIVVTPLGEMKKLVQDSQIGVVAEGHTPMEMAKALNSLTPEQINTYKKNSLALAKTLNAEHEMGKLMGIYAEMLAG